MPTVDYALNISQRMPCMLVLDASGSMTATEGNGLSRIDMLNEGLVVFDQELRADEIVLSRAQIAAVNVGGPTASPELILDWTDAITFQPFRLTANGGTPLGEGVILALDAIEQQKARLRSYGISYTRPWMFILTDGETSDHEETWVTACKKVRDAEAGGKVQVYPVGIGEFNPAKLAELSRTPPLRMDNTRFRELFVWLSGSLGSVSRSAPGQEVPLPSTDPWAAVKL